MGWEFGTFLATRARPCAIFKQPACGSLVYEVSMNPKKSLDSTCIYRAYAVHSFNVKQQPTKKGTMKTKLFFSSCHLIAPDVWAYWLDSPRWVRGNLPIAKKMAIIADGIKFPVWMPVCLRRPTHYLRGALAAAVWGIHVAVAHIEARLRDQGIF